MIKLTKLRLINWHYFTNTTVDIENITFLTGANGTGKSTIIDALQTVLLGDTTGRNFNKAANEKTGRTLNGYLRGEISETKDGNVVSLRPGRFTAYIALEFADTKKKTQFTLGIVFDCFSDGHDDRHFFYLNTGFPSNNFTNKDLLDANSSPRPLTYKEFSRFVSENYKSDEARFFDSNEQYRQFLKTILAICQISISLCLRNPFLLYLSLIFLNLLQNLSAMFSIKSILFLCRRISNNIDYWKPSPLEFKIKFPC